MKNLNQITNEEEKRTYVIEFLSSLLLETGYAEGDGAYEEEQEFYSEQSTEYLEKAYERNTDRKRISDEEFVDFMIKCDRWCEDDRQRLIENFELYQDYGWHGLCDY